MTAGAANPLVILVEDDTDTLSTLRDMLVYADFEVETATDGFKALKLLSMHPDAQLLLTDIVMPEMEGLELIRKTKRTYPRVKIIAISGGGTIKNSTYLDMAHNLGADGVLAKPFSRDELLTKINAVLQTGKA